MRLRLLFSFYILFCALSVQAQDTLLFTEALAKGQIKVTVKGQGGHSGQCVSVHIERLTDKPFRIKIPAGHLFEPQDSNMQSIIVVKNEAFTLNAKKQFIKVYGLCARASKASPSVDAAFDIGATAQGILLKMAEYIALKKLWNEPDAQYAIWCMSDSIQPASLHHPGLLATACQLLGQPLPQYKINYPKNTTAATRTITRPQPVLERKPMSVEGKFDFYSKVDTEISIYVQNAAGERVRTIFEKEKHPMGQGTYSFFFQTNKLATGTYEVVLYDKEKAVKKIRVRY